MIDESKWMRMLASFLFLGLMGVVALDGLNNFWADGVTAALRPSIGPLLGETVAQAANIAVLGIGTAKAFGK
jgi:hypothetical protein